MSQKYIPPEPSTRDVRTRTKSPRAGPHGKSWVVSLVPRSENEKSSRKIRRVNQFASIGISYDPPSTAKLQLSLSTPTWNTTVNFVFCEAAWGRSFSRPQAHILNRKHSDLRARVAISASRRNIPAYRAVWRRYLIVCEKLTLNSGYFWSYPRNG